VKALILGGASWNRMVFLDAFPEPRPHTLFARGTHETVGSSGAGKALNLTRLGWDTTLWAVVGEDDAGDAIARRMGAEGIELVRVADPAGTMRHVNLMDRAGDRISIFAVPGTLDLEVDHRSMAEAMATADLVAVTIFQHCRGFLPLARQLGVGLWIDIHDYDGVTAYHDEFIAAATRLQVSTGTLPEWRVFAEHRLQAGTELVVCTHGARGASVLTGDGWFEIEVEPVDPVDTNGAGDAFFAGFATAWIDGRGAQAALELGAAAAREAVLAAELAPPRKTEEGG
jgi:acarbose 7IV-phosphotransferase